jgi:hypothetical protein
MGSVCIPGVDICGKWVWSRTSIDVIEPTGVEVHVPIVWQRMIDYDQLKSVGNGSIQLKSVNGMAAYVRSLSVEWQQMR